MKGPASHIRHMKSKRRFNEARSQHETRRQVNKTKNASPPK